MRRREALGIGAAAVAAIAATTPRADAQAIPLRRLTPPARRPINVAFVVGPLSNLIDFAGPAEVFQDTYFGTLAGQEGPFLHGPDMPFSVYLVSDTLATFEAGPELRVLPQYLLSAAPPPDVVVVGATSPPSEEKLNWIRAQVPRADLTMSVCTGAYVLAQAGLLDGLNATTHHSFYDDFAQRYPKVHLVRGQRFVENERISCAGGLTSGIDLALHVVARYFGEDVANHTASWMEYARMTDRPA
jgi:transcriptional regulator GlxA family with amidase domain